MSVQDPELDIQDLVALPPKMTALDVFSAKFEADTIHPITPILERVRSEVAGFTPDVTSNAGRKIIKSLAYRVTRAKTTLDSIGKELAAEQKEVPKRIDATRKYCRDILEALASDVRAPLDAWEAAEEDRKAKHIAALAWIAGLHTPSMATVEELRTHIGTLDSIVVSADACGEYEAEYRLAIDAARPVLLAHISQAEKRESEASELAKLRAEAEALEKERDAERLRKEGEERARLKLESEARAERDRAEREAARKDAEHRSAIEAAELRAAEAAAQVWREVDAAARKEALDKAVREADKAHRATINNAVRRALVENGIDESVATTIITLIVKGKIPNITINY